MSDRSLAWLSASQLATLYARRELSPVEVVEAMLTRAATLQPHLNAFVLIDEAGARSAAKASEARWQKGAPLSPLDGVPTTIKDTTPVKGWPTRYGSHATDETPAAENAPAVDRLQAAGMVLLGKTTTPEFGWKALTDSPLQGTTRSPWNLKHSPGGSSGGASSLTAAGVNPFNHGNDGGGSIRIPAAHTGLVGLKPSYGRIAQYPADSAVRRRDQPGRAVAHRARHGAGAERRWPAPIRATGARCRPSRATTRSASTKACAAWRLGLSLDFGHVEGRPRGARAGRRRRQALRGARRRRRGGRAADRAPAEFLRAAVDRQLRHAFAPDPDAAARQARSRLPRRRRERDWPITLADYARAYEAKSKLARDMALWHRQYDLLLAPVTPTAAPPVETLYNSDAFPRWTKGAPYTLPFNLTGQPAASMPAGLTTAGLPVGLQIVGPPAPIISCCGPCAPTKAPPAGPGRSPRCWRPSPGSEHALPTRM